MSREVRYHPLAADELVVAQAWYDERVAGLGDRFLEAVSAAVARVMEWPDGGVPVVVAADGTVVNRKVGLAGFPWAVAYEVVDGALVVLAVFHQRRIPDYWTSRA